MTLVQNKFCVISICNTRNIHSIMGSKQSAIKKSKKYRHGHKLKSKRITTKIGGTVLENNGTVFKKKGKMVLEKNRPRTVPENWRYFMIKLVLVRHGQSEWNLENRFTGWTDVELSPKGIQEAKRSRNCIKK